LVLQEVTIPASSICCFSVSRRGFDLALCFGSTGEYLYPPLEPLWLQSWLQCGSMNFGWIAPSLQATPHLFPGLECEKPPTWAGGHFARVRGSASSYSSKPKKIGASCARTYILSRFPRASNNSSTDQKATSRHKMMCFLKVETCPILNIRDLFMLHGRDRWSMKRITTWRGGRSSCLFWGKKKRPFGLCFNH